MLSEFETSMSDYRCQFHCPEKYKSILMEIFWHDFSERFYPEKWLLSFRDELQKDFHWPWLEECRKYFRKEGAIPDLWERNKISLDGEVPVHVQLSALSRTITAVYYARKKYRNLVSILTGLEWQDVLIPSGPAASTVDAKIAEERNPTLRYDLLNKGYLSAPPYYPYDHCHIRLKKIKKTPS